MYTSYYTREMALTRNNIIERYMYLNVEADISLSTELIKKFATESYCFIEVFQRQHNVLDINLCATVTEPTITISLPSSYSITHKNQQKAKSELCILTMTFATNELIVRYNNNNPKLTLTNKKKYETDIVMNKEEILETIKNKGLKSKASNTVADTANTSNVIGWNTAKTSKLIAQHIEPSKVPIENLITEKFLCEENDLSLKGKEKSDLECCKICSQKDHDVSNCESPKRCKYNLCATREDAHIFDRGTCKKVQCKICSYNHHTQNCKSYRSCRYNSCVTGNHPHAYNRIICNPYSTSKKN